MEKIIWLLFALQTVSNIVSSQTNLTTDQTSLLMFKSDITSDSRNSILSTNWSANSSCCSWIGVTCNTSLTRVTSLNLSRLGLDGTISPHLGNLSGLVSLDLSYNSLHGEIPEEIGYLTNLEKFHARENMLQGSIPPSLFNISSLVELILRNNSLLGNLPPDMCNRLSSLMILSIRNNNIMGSIPLGIENCSSLVSMDFTGNKLTGAIPQGLGNLRNLQNIIFEFNSLSGDIPSNIFNISTLRIMTLSSNHLTGKLPPTFGVGLPSLSELYMWGNKLSGIIPTSISNASMLTTLDLNSNSFTGFVPDSLGNLALLQRLNLQYNLLGSSTKDMEFLTSLTKCRYLTVLGLSGNLITGILPNSIGNFSASFTQFYVGDCNVEGSIPSAIGNLTNLIILQLGKNKLTGGIPTAIGNLQYLQGLEFSENLLQGPIPGSICLLSRLGFLYLSHNEFSGPILECIGELSALKVLSLDSNKLSSVIPATLARLTTILDINMSTNSLTGNIPLTIGNMKMLKQLDLSNNKFYGNIPVTITSLQSLVNLSLAHNKLQGNISSSFGNMISLESLDMSYNNLSGVIPKSLEKLEYLKKFNVSYNTLHGEIPNGGPFAKFSAQSFIMNKALCGASRFGVSPCKTSGRKKSTNKLVFYILPALLILVLVIILYMVIRYRKRKTATPTDEMALLSSNCRWQRISHHELLQATSKFNETNLLGTGSYGSVYKGTLADGSVVAIKVFNLQIEGAFKSFDAECEILCNVRHRNLLKVISVCSNDDFKALVLEYMPNGSLEEWLDYGHNDYYWLDFMQRLSIMMDVAFGLEYIHHSYEVPILHCDLKPSNILLDEDMVAHIGDFGISKLLGDGEFLAQTRTLATIGYMAPEYGSGGIVSTKNDVYAYGIVLMETFTKKRHSDEMFTNNMTLKRWIAEAISSHDITDVATEFLLVKEDENYATKQDLITTILKLALQCCAESPENRVNIKDALTVLNDVKTSFLISIKSKK